MKNEIPNILIDCGWDQEKYEFYIFMTDPETNKWNRIRNALIRAGIKSIKQFAGLDPETFTSFKGIGFTSLSWLMEHYNKARELYSLEPISDLDYDKLIVNLRNKMIKNKIEYCQSYGWTDRVPYWKSKLIKTS